MWLHSIIDSDAAVNDFLLMEGISKHKEFDAKWLELDKLAKQRWYLQQETVIYFLFCDNPIITDAEKHEVARKLLEILWPEFFCIGLPVSNKPLNLERSCRNIVQNHALCFMRLVCI